MTSKPRSLIGLKVALVSALSVSASAEASSYEVDDREPIAFVLSTPTGQQANVGSSELIRRIDRGLRIDTSLALQPLSTSLVSACRGRLGCLALKARTDYDPSALGRPGGGLLPYREHVRRLKEAGIGYPRYLLVVSNVTLPDRADRLSVALVDTDIALQLFHEARRDHPDWDDRFEARVDSGALVGDTVSVQVTTADQVSAFFTRFLRHNVRRRLERTGHWRPFGRVRLKSNVPRAAIVWDGRTVGSTARGDTQLTQARAGQHSLTIEHPEYEPSTHNVEVTAGATSVMQVNLRRKPGQNSLGRQIVLWTGVGLVAVGGAIGIYALTQQDGDAVTVCVDCPSGRSFQSAGYNPEAGIDEAINPSGVLIGPLGYSIAATGATWSLGALLSDDEFPWLPMVIGLAIGGLSYGLSTAFNDP